MAHCRRINVFRPRRIRPGPIQYATPTGTIQLDQQVDPVTLVRLINGVDRAGLEFRQVIAADVRRGHVTFTIIDTFGGDITSRQVTVSA